MESCCAGSVKKRWATNGVWCTQNLRFSLYLAWLLVTEYYKIHSQLTAVDYPLII